MAGEKRIHGTADPQPGGRSPAPGDLGVVQAFMNSRWDLATDDHRDALADPDALRAWLEARGLGAGGRLGEGDLERALAVREGLRALAFTNNGHAPDAAAIDGLGEATRGAGTRIHLGPDGPRFVPDRAEGIEVAISELLAITARAMIDGSWRRLKACPGRHCGWAFYDHSRNQSGRWCAMKVCGDRDKARSYYRRRTGGADADRALRRV
jgi:predicted RNA-binding Zn ribbon-like protein